MSKLFGKEWVKKEKKRAKQLEEEIKEKKRKDRNTQAIFGWIIFLVYAGLTGVGAYIVYLIIRALLKYIES